MTSRSEGNKFQDDFKKSCPKEGIIERIKDVPIFNKDPNWLPPKISKNPCDFIMFLSPFLFYIELKSTKEKSFSFSEKIIKQKQIEGLQKRAGIPNVFPGFIFNFRSTFTNETYYVHINDFIKYKNNAKRKSIPLDVCQKIGIKIENHIKISRYWYDLEGFIEANRRRQVG